MKKLSIQQLNDLAKEIALITLEISYLAKTGHVGSALSISDLLTVLYFSQLSISKHNLSSNTRDRFILSKGHAAAALYATLYKKEILSKKELYSFGQDEGGLCEHPEIKDSGIEMSSGSLGHGLAFSIGIALAQKRLSLKSRTYVLISDGECGEGSVWEAGLLASRLQLDNLTVIIDYNKWQCFGKSPDISNLEPFTAKWNSFGWIVREIDGHNIRKIQKTFHALPFKKNKPSIIIAHTISGKKIQLIENKLIGHYKVFTEEEYKRAKRELANKL